MKATLIINPLSGKRQAPKVRAVAERIAAELGVTLATQVIDGPGHGTKIAREAAAAGIDRVISAGGDGTLNAVAAGLVGTKVPVAVLGFGSGNGYVRSLQLPRDPEQAIQLALTGEARLVDVCYLNDRLFVGTAGIGFDARVAAAFEKSKRGAWNYMRIILQEILGAKPMRVVVKANGRTVEEHVLMMVFANSREFGNGAIISPGSLVDDGLAELQIVRKPALLPLLRAFYDLYTGSVDRNRNVRTIVTDEASVHQDGTVAHLDGESVEIGNEVRFRLEAKKLWVIR